MSRRKLTNPIMYSFHCQICSVINFEQFHSYFTQRKEQQDKVLMRDKVLRRRTCNEFRDFISINYIVYSYI